MFTKTKTGLASAALATAALSAVMTAPDVANAEEILLTGPLAGAPAVRRLRLYRQGRFELSPNVSFTLLDEYRRQIFLGLRANYGFTDWLSAGVWGGISSSLVGLDINTSLTSEIQEVNEGRDCNNTGAGSLDCTLTAVNLGENFEDQVASMEWIAAPQVTATPFRGKLGLFNSIFVDADLYIFAGVAFVGVQERADCEGNCSDPASFATASRMAIAPTGGLGFTFYMSRWTAVGFEYRALPFEWNTAGFDTAGREGESVEIPDGNVNAEDREFKFNQMLTLNFNMYLPMQNKVSE
jgi:hypothetical protein